MVFPLKMTPYIYIYHSPATLATAYYVGLTMYRVLLQLYGSRRGRIYAEIYGDLCLQKIILMRSYLKNMWKSKNNFILFLLNFLLILEFQLFIKKIIFYLFIAYQRSAASYACTDSVCIYTMIREISQLFFKRWKNCQMDHTHEVSSWVNTTGVSVFIYL